MRGGDDKDVAARPVRLAIEFTPRPDGVVAGQLGPAGGRPVRFEGWLELLRLLEGVVMHPEPSMRPPSPHLSA